MQLLSGVPVWGCMEHPSIALVDRLVQCFGFVFGGSGGWGRWPATWR